MGLTPEERRNIYEEEKARIDGARIEANQPSSTGLPPNVAALLCYLGIWVTGIIFLVLEQKDRNVRFHAAQSIVVFGGLNILFAILHPIPVIGWAFGPIIGIAALVLWVFLMARAYQGEHFRLPVAGTLAEALAGILVTRSGQPSQPSSPPGAAPPQPPQPPPPPIPPTPPILDTTQRLQKGLRSARTGRVVGSSFAIAWSIAGIIFFSFFSRYIAYYYIEHHGVTDVWVRVPVLTADYGQWLTVLNTTLIVTIFAHVLFIAYDKYVLREGGLIILNILGIATAVSLLTIYPFSFTGITDHAVADGIDIGIKVTLGIVVFLMAVTTLANFIRLIVNLLRGTATYP